MRRAGFPRTFWPWGIANARHHHAAQRCRVGSWLCRAVNSPLGRVVVWLRDTLSLSLIFSLLQVKQGHAELERRNSRFVQAEEAVEHERLMAEGAGGDAQEGLAPQGGEHAEGAVWAQLVSGAARESEEEERHATRGRAAVPIQALQRGRMARRRAQHMRTATITRLEALAKKPEADPREI